MPLLLRGWMVHDSLNVNLAKTRSSSSVAVSFAQNHSNVTETPPTYLSPIPPGIGSCLHRDQSGVCSTCHCCFAVPKTAMESLRFLRLVSEMSGRLQYKK